MAGRREAIELCGRHGAAVVIDALAPWVSEERRARIAAVVAARLDGLTVVLEDLYDPHNGAAAIRSVEGLGLSSIHVVERAGPFRAEKEISLGGEKWIDVHRHRDPGAAQAALAAAGFLSLATTPAATTTLADLDPRGRYALWFGNERDGLTPEAIGACHREITIPMPGMTRSFNLSVAVALLTAESSARRRAALGAHGDLDPVRRQELTARYYAQSVRGAAGILGRTGAPG
jgi:tRNA (guanosine-2'-O-)-methyltransferase